MRCRCDGLSACLVHTKELKRTIYSDSWVEHGRNMAKTEWIRNMVGQHARSVVPRALVSVSCSFPPVETGGYRNVAATRLGSIIWKASYAEGILQFLSFVGPFILFSPRSSSQLSPS